MKNAGILEGDFVVVRPQETAGDGEIVVALVGEEATVKRFFREDDHVRLQPENETMEPIRSREVRVVGPRGRRVPEGGMSDDARCLVASASADDAAVRRAGDDGRSRLWTTASSGGLGGPDRRRPPPLARVCGGELVPRLLGRRRRRRRPLPRLRQRAELSRRRSPRPVACARHVRRRRTAPSSPALEEEWMQARCRTRDRDRLEELVARRLPLHRDPPAPGADDARAVDGRGDARATRS